MVHCALPPWLLVFLQGRVASEASYPAWSATDISRPKVLVFLSQIGSLVYGHGALRMQPPRWGSTHCTMVVSP